MTTFTQTVSATIAEMLPPHFTDKEEVTADDIHELNWRILNVNHLLLAVLDGLKNDPYFWRNVDRSLFSETLKNNKAAVKEMRSFIRGESYTLALLDSVQSNIGKLERSLAEYPTFNFDLERMKAHVECESIRLPDNLKSAEELRQWLLRQA